MQAITQQRYGGTDMLQLSEIDVPTPKADEVLIRVASSSINPLDWYFMTGLPYIARPALGGVRPVPVRGRDVAGVVAAVGADVTDFNVGDRCVGFCYGAFAEYTVAKPNNLAHAPDGIALTTLGAVPVVGTTAWHACVTHGQLAPGTKTLVIGASGGVGSFVTQIAAHLGAEVTGVCRGSNAELVHSWGARHVIDYTTTDMCSGDTTYDVIIDIVGNRSCADLRRIMAPDGRFVVVGAPSGGNWFGPVSRLVAAQLAFVGRSQKCITFTAPEGRDDIELVLDLIRNGTLNPHISSTVDLAGVPAALDAWRAGGTVGKRAVVVDDTLA